MSQLDQEAWEAPTDSEAIVTRVDPWQERKTRPMEPPEKNAGMGPTVLALIVGALAVGGMYYLNKTRKPPATPPVQATNGTESR